MTLIERVPPQNNEAEQAVLGSILIDPESIAKTVDILTVKDFYRETHRLIYATMLKLFEKREAIDLITVVEDLRKAEKLDAAGGISYITSLANSVPTSANIVYYAKIVEEKAQLRNLINAGTNIATIGYEASEELPSIMDQAEKMLLEVSTRKNGSSFVAVKDIVMGTFDQIQKLYNSKGGLTGLATGFKDFDRLTSGLQASDFIIIAARPSMGKTAFVLNIAANVAMKQALPVAFFSLEMSKEQLVQRLLCAEAAIDSQKLRQGNIDEKTDWDKLVKASGEIWKAPLFIDDTAGLTAMEIRSKARQLKAEHGLSLIIIDYLQLMSGNGSGRKNENRQQEISDISRSLKALARELNVPVIALSQLSRQVEARQVKKPMLSDLRESGSLEQDADVVSFLYREDYYNPDTDKKNITELIVAKQRNGPINTIELFFHKAITRFVDLCRTQE